MGFYRFRSNVDICGTRVSSGDKASLSGDNIVVTRFTRAGKDRLLKMDKDKFFKKMEKHPTTLRIMKENIERRIQI
jgi:CRP-like cAMP-binding protein